MSRRDGFVLIAALWLVLALSAVGLDLSLRARESRLVAANRLEGARARAAAEAGVEQARSWLTTLLDPEKIDDSRERLSTFVRAPVDALDSWSALAAFTQDAVRLGEAGYTTEYRDAASLLHLNLAEEEQLRRFFRAMHVDFGEADRLAQAICDWRDADDLRRARGAERNEYARAAAFVLPRNGPFADVFELRHVRGMTPALLARVAPFLTVHGTGGINLNTAPDPVLLALPGMTPAALDVIHARRRSRRPIRLLQELADELPPTARQAFLANSADFVRLATFETREIQVTSTGGLEGSPVQARVTAVFARAGGTAYLVWRRAE